MKIDPKNEIDFDLLSVLVETLRNQVGTMSVLQRSMALDELEAAGFVKIYKACDPEKGAGQPRQQVTPEGRQVVLAMAEVLADEVFLEEIV